MFPFVIEKVAEELIAWVATSAGWDIAKKSWERLFAHLGEQPRGLASFGEYAEAHDLLRRFLRLYCIFERDVEGLVEAAFHLVSETSYLVGRSFGEFDIPRRNISEHDARWFAQELAETLSKAESCLHKIASAYEDIESDFPLVVVLLAHNLPSRERIDTIVQYDSTTFMKSNPELVSELSKEDEKGGIPIFPGGGLKGFKLLDEELGRFLISSFARGKWCIQARYTSLLDIDRLALLLIEARNDTDSRWAYCMRIFFELRKLDCLTKFMVDAIQETSRDLLEMRETGRIPEDVRLRIAIFQATRVLTELSEALRRVKRRAKADENTVQKSKLEEALELQRRAQDLLKEASAGWPEARVRLSKARKSKTLATRALRSVRE